MVLEARGDCKVVWRGWNLVSKHFLFCFPSRKNSERFRGSEHQLYAAGTQICEHRKLRSEKQVQCLCDYLALLSSIVRAP